MARSGVLGPAAGGTLVTCDAVQNQADTEFASFGGKLMMSAMGFKGGVIVPPMWRRFQKLSGDALRQKLSLPRRTVVREP